MTFKRLLAAAAAMLLTVCVSATAFADVSASADNGTPTGGDTVTVELTVTGEKLSVAEGTFTYDASMLSFEEAEGGASDGFFALYSAEKDGSSSLSARIKFKTLSAGEAAITFTLESLLDYSGKALDTGEATVTLTVAEAPAEPTAPPIDYSSAEYGVKAENVEGVEADMYIWRNIDNVTIPSRYTESDIDYHGETVKGAAVADSDAPTLLYLSEADGANAGYYIYDMSRDALYGYKTISSVSRSYIILNPEGTAETPAGFTETTLTVDNTEYTAWTSEETGSDVYLIYARNPDGEVGFYYYSVSDSAVQRYALFPTSALVSVPTPAPTVAPTPAATEAPVETVPEGTMNVPSTLVYVVCGAAALFLILFVATIVMTSVRESNRRKRAAERRKKDREAMEAAARELNK